MNHGGRDHDGVGGLEPGRRPDAGGGPGNSEINVCDRQVGEVLEKCLDDTDGRRINRSGLTNASVTVTAEMRAGFMPGATRLSRTIAAAGAAHHGGAK